MRTTVDIADEDYAKLKALAALKRTSVKALITSAVHEQLERQPAKRPRKPLPVVPSKTGRLLDLSHERVNELLLDLP